MSFYFRKLRTRQLMPIAKRSLGFGFSTRVNEHEKDKTGCNEQPSTEAMSSICAGLIDESENVGNTDHFNAGANILSYFQSDRCLVPAVPPHSAIVPVTLTDLQTVLTMDRNCKLKGQCSAVDLSSRSRDILDFFSATVKPVHLTSDDILINSPGFRDDIDYSRLLCERVLVDVLTEQSSYAETKHNNNRNHRNRCEVQNHSTDLISPMFSGHNTLDFSLSSVPEGSDFQRSDNLHTLFSTPGGDGVGGPLQSNQSAKEGPPSEDIHDIRGKLEHMVTNLFTRHHNYSLLHKNVVLENNLFGDNEVAIGTTQYAFALLKLRLKVHARYSSTEMEILNVSTLEHNGIIRIHWRLKGVPQTQLLKFWKMFQYTKDDVDWMEAFSYFHIGKDGLVHKHRIDRMLPDNERTTNKLSKKIQSLLNPAKPLVS